MDDESIGWRWVDDKGREMTKWKRGGIPPVLDLHDGKGCMHVELRGVQQTEGIDEQ
jgi:hypothetical protein